MIHSRSPLFALCILTIVAYPPRRASTEVNRRSQKDLVQGGGTEQILVKDRKVVPLAEEVTTLKWRKIKHKEKFDVYVEPGICKEGNASDVTDQSGNKLQSLSPPATGAITCTFITAPTPDQEFDYFLDFKKAAMTRKQPSNGPFAVRVGRCGSCEP